MQTFFKNGELKYFQVATTPLSLDFDGLPYPVLGVPPDFLHQNDRKGCKRDCLDARGHFILRFGAIGDKPLGGGNHPFLGRRGLNVKLDRQNTFLYNTNKPIKSSLTGRSLHARRSTNKSLSKNDYLEVGATTIILI